MSFPMHAQREANQRASLSNKFGLCHLSARYCNIGYSFSSMDDCSLKTTQLRGFHPAFLCPHRKLLVRFSTLVMRVVRKCVVQNACMAHLNKSTTNSSALPFLLEDVCLFCKTSLHPFSALQNKDKDMGRYRIPVPVMREQEKMVRFPLLFITLIIRTASCKFSFLTIFNTPPFSINNVRPKMGRNLV